MRYGDFYAKLMTKDALCKGLSSLFEGNSKLSSEDKKRLLDISMTQYLDEILDHMNDCMGVVSSVGGICYHFLMDACVSVTDCADFPAHPILWEKPAVEIGGTGRDYGNYFMYFGTYMDVEGCIFHTASHYWSDQTVNFDMSWDDVLKLGSVAAFNKWVSHRINIDFHSQLIKDQTVGKDDGDVPLLIVRTLSNHGGYRFNSLLDPLPDYLKQYCK